MGVGGSTKDGAAKIWCQLVVELLRNFKNRILGGWLSLQSVPVVVCRNVFFIDQLQVVRIGPVDDRICAFVCLDLGVPP